LKESGDFSDLEFDEDDEEAGSGFDSEEDEFAGILSEDEDQARMDEDEAFGSDGISDEELEVPSDDDDHEEMGELGSSEEEEEEGSESEESDEEDIESEFEGSELSFNEGDEEDESGAMTMTFGDEPAPVPSTSSTPASTSTTGRYVPPHLRNKEPSTPAPPPPSSKPSDSLEAPPDDPRLRRLLNGHLNKLSPQNISTIYDALLSLYQSNPRAVVSSTLTQLLLGIVSDRDNLGDQLMITYACLVASLFRGIGIEFPAGVLTQSINLLDASLSKADQSTGGRETESEGGFEGKPGSKQAQNLVAFLSELYNFGVVGCGVVYDLVRMFVERGKQGLGELEVELLSKIVKRESSRSLCTGFFSLH